VRVFYPIHENYWSGKPNSATSINPIFGNSIIISPNNIILLMKGRAFTEIYYKPHLLPKNYYLLQNKNAPLLNPAIFLLNICFEMV